MNKRSVSEHPKKETKTKLNFYKFYNPEPIKLPPNFAEDILNLELEMERPKVQLDQVLKLIDLYKIGVEYFESIKNDKYVIFTNKTQNLFLRPNVLQCLSGGDKQDSVAIQQKQQQQDDNIINNQMLSSPSCDILKLKMENNVKTQINQSSEQNNSIKELMTSFNSTLARTNNLIGESLTNQDQQIKERLNRRKSLHSRRY